MKGRQISYEGVLVGELLKRAGAPVGRDLSGKAVATYVRASAKDGYQVVFSLAELDPGFTPNDIIVADTIDGKPLFDYQGPFRIVAPHDKRGARSIRMLQRLEVVRLRQVGAVTQPAMVFGDRGRVLGGGARPSLSGRADTAARVRVESAARISRSRACRPTNPMSEAKAELGRHLFYDTRLSGNGTQSCATCHEQERAFTDGRARAVGSTGEVHPARQHEPGQRRLRRGR